MTEQERILARKLNFLIDVVFLLVITAITVASVGGLVYVELANQKPHPQITETK